MRGWEVMGNKWSRIRRNEQKLEDESRGSEGQKGWKFGKARGRGSGDRDILAG